MALDYALSVYQRRKLARPPCETFRRNVRGMAGMPPTGGSPDWRIPCVAQCSPSAESMSVAEHAREFLRRSLCAAYGAEFFLYEKMGRRVIVPAGSTIGDGEQKVCTDLLPTPFALKKTGIQGEPAPLGRCSRAEPSRSSRCEHRLLTLPRPPEAAPRLPGRRRRRTLCRSGRAPDPGRSPDVRGVHGARSRSRLPG